MLARGLVFGPLTYFLVYFAPFIWLGNLVLMVSFKNIFSKFGYASSVFISAVAKFLFLFIIANIYFKLSLVPAIFINLMGLNQLSTALAGGLASYLIWIIYRKIHKS